MKKNLLTTMSLWFILLMLIAIDYWVFYQGFKAQMNYQQTKQTIVDWDNAEREGKR